MPPVSHEAPRGRRDPSTSTLGTSVNAIADRETSPWADATYLKDYLRDDQYRSDANLRARQAIYSFQEPRINLPGAVIDLANPADDDVVMDIGCGNGAYLAEIARRGHRGPVIGIDLSTGMLETARQAAPAAHVVAGDASSLPLRKGTARLVLAAHMLYHVADPMTAISECRRASLVMADWWSCSTTRTTCTNYVKP